MADKVSYLGGTRPPLIEPPEFLDPTATEVFELTAQCLAGELRHEHAPHLALYSLHMAECIALSERLAAASTFEEADLIRRARARESAEALRWARALRLTVQASTRAESVYARRHQP